MKQNITKHPNDGQAKGNPNGEDDKRFDTNQNLSIMLQERLKDKYYVAKKVKDLTVKCKRRIVQPDDPNEIEGELQIPSLKPVTVKPKRQSTKPKQTQDTVQ